MKSDKLIVLDLDETLFSCEYIEQEMESDYVLSFDDSPNSLYHTVLRPHVNKFISYIKENFEYGVFTAASEDYALEHMKRLHIDNPIFFLSQERCTHKYIMTSGWSNESVRVKKLSKIKKYKELSKVISIDDKYYSYMENYGNLVQVPPFNGNNPKDDVLLKLINYLEDLKKEKNILKVEKRGWISRY